MNSNKKFLSIFGFFGILAGLITINFFFLKISKSVVELSKEAQNKNTLQANLKLSNFNNNDNSDSLFSQSIINKNNKNIASINNGKIDEFIKNNIAEQETKIEAKNFLELENKNFIEVGANDTIKQRFPDFPSIELNPPKKEMSIQNPMIDSSISEPEIESNITQNILSNTTINSEEINNELGIKITNTTSSTNSENKTIPNNSNQPTNDTLSVIISENTTLSIKIINEAKNSSEVTISSDNNTVHIDTTQDMIKNTTVVIISSENITIPIDASQGTTKNTTTVNISENITVIVEVPKDNINTTSEIESISNSKDQNVTSNSNITQQDTVVINNNETTIYSDNTSISSNDHSNITVTNVSNLNITEDQCDFENDEENVSVIVNDKTEEKKHHQKNKHHKNKHHGKKCRNKKHVHYLQLLNEENDLNERIPITDDISVKNIVETVNGSSYTEAALSKLIVVDHTQVPKLEKSENVVVDEVRKTVEAKNSPIQQNENNSLTQEKKDFSKTEVKRIIRVSKNDENSSKRISFVASILSLFVFAGICLLGFEIHKNHKNANIIVTENNEIDKKFDYVLLDNEETQTSSREIGIQEI